MSGLRILVPVKRVIDYAVCTPQLQALSTHGSFPRPNFSFDDDNAGLLSPEHRTIN